MRPILMTALATVAGLLPIALKIGEGSEASAPLARAAVGGLAVSTALTLFLVPAFTNSSIRAGRSTSEVARMAKCRDDRRAGLRVERLRAARRERNNTDPSRSSA